MGRIGEEEEEEEEEGGEGVTFPANHLTARFSASANFPLLNESSRLQAQALNRKEK